MKRLARSCKVKFTCILMVLVVILVECGQSAPSSTSSEYVHDTNVRHKTKRSADLMNFLSNTLLEHAEGEWPDFFQMFNYGYAEDPQSDYENSLVEFNEQRGTKMNAPSVDYTCREEEHNHNVIDLRYQYEGSPRNDEWNTDDGGAFILANDDSFGQMGENSYDYGSNSVSVDTDWNQAIPPEENTEIDEVISRNFYMTPPKWGTSNYWTPIVIDSEAQDTNGVNDDDEMVLVNSFNLLFDNERDFRYFTEYDQKDLKVDYDEKSEDQDCKDMLVGDDKIEQNKTEIEKTVTTEGSKDTEELCTSTVSTLTDEEIKTTSAATKVVSNTTSYFIAKATVQPAEEDTSPSGSTRTTAAIITTESIPPYTTQIGDFTESENKGGVSYQTPPSADAVTTESWNGMTNGEASYTSSTFMNGEIQIIAVTSETVVETVTNGMVETTLPPVEEDITTSRSTAISKTTTDSPSTFTSYTDKSFTESENEGSVPKGGKHEITPSTDLEREGLSTKILNGMTIDGENRSGNSVDDTTIDVTVVDLQLVEEDVTASGGITITTERAFPYTSYPDTITENKIEEGTTKAETDQTTPYTGLHTEGPLTENLSSVILDLDESSTTFITDMTLSVESSTVKE